MADYQKDGEQPPLHYEGAIPIIPGEAEREQTARQAEQIAEREYKQRQMAIQAGILKTQIALVAFGIVGAGIGIYQAHTARINADAANSAAQTARDTLIEIQKNAASSTGQFNIQLGKLDDSVKQSSRLADATEKANANILGADRPWISGWMQVSDFDAGKKPTFTWTFTNTGKRPARVTLSANRESLYAGFPPNPDEQYIFDTTPSTNFVVPGQGVLSTTVADTELTQQEIDLLSSQTEIQFFAFAKVEYIDVKTNAKYWTHLCFRYIPKFKTTGNGGFRNCTEYNDAK